MDDSSFFSINRLVEFGMGMAVAQQMVKTMNESMTNMHVPGAMNPMEKPKEKFFYAMLEGKQAGPRATPPPRLGCTPFCLAASPRMRDATSPPPPEPREEPR